MPDDLFDRVLNAAIAARLAQKIVPQQLSPVQPLIAPTTGPPDIVSFPQPFSGLKKISAPTTPFGAKGQRTRLYEYSIPASNNGYIDYLGFDTDAQNIRMHLIIDGQDKFGQGGMETFPGTTLNPVKTEPWWKYEVHESVIVEYENFGRAAPFLSCYVSGWYYNLKDSAAVLAWLK